MGGSSCQLSVKIFDLCRLSVNLGDLGGLMIKKKLIITIRYLIHTV